MPLRYGCYTADLRYGCYATDLRYGCYTTDLRYGCYTEDLRYGYYTLDLQMVSEISETTFVCTKNMVSKIFETFITRTE